MVTGHTESGSRCSWRGIGYRCHEALEHGLADAELQDDAVEEEVAVVEHLEVDVPRSANFVRER